MVASLGVDGEREEKVRKRLDRLGEAVAALERGTPAVEAVRSELHAVLDARVGEVHARLDAESHGVGEDVRGRLDQLAGELQERLAAGVASGEELRARVEELAGVVASLGVDGEREEKVRKRLDRLGEAVAALERGTPAVEAVRSELHAVLDARVGEVHARLDAESHGVGEDVRGRLDQLAGELQERSAAGVASGEELRARVEELAGVVASLGVDGEREEKVRKRLDRLGEAVAALERGTPAVEAVRSELHAVLDARVGEVHARFDAEAHGLDAVHEQLDSLASTVRALESTAAAGADEAVRSRVDILAGELHAALEARVGEVHGRLDAERPAAEALRQQVEGLLAAVDALGATTGDRDDKLRRRLDRLSESVATLEHGLGQVAAARTSVAADLHAAIDRSVGELRTELETHSVRSDQRDAERAALDAAVHERLDAVAADVSALAGRGTHAVESVRNELETRLAQGFEKVVPRLDAVETRVSGVETRSSDRAVSTPLRATSSAARLSLGTSARRARARARHGRHRGVAGVLEALEQRVDAQTGIVEEQSRVTERAVRKGLAAIGERIADSEARTSRRGRAASVGRAARLGDRGCGSRDRCAARRLTGRSGQSSSLRRRRGIGSRVRGGGRRRRRVLELAEVKGPVVVARVGLSPLPFDRRPCLFVERWRPTTAPGDD